MKLQHFLEFQVKEKLTKQSKRREQRKTEKNYISLNNNTLLEIKFASLQSKSSFYPMKLPKNIFRKYDRLENGNPTLFCTCGEKEKRKKVELSLLSQSFFGKIFFRRLTRSEIVLPVGEAHSILKSTHEHPQTKK